MTRNPTTQAATPPTHPDYPKAAARVADAMATGQVNPSIPMAGASALTISNVIRDLAGPADLPLSQ